MGCPAVIVTLGWTIVSGDAQAETEMATASATAAAEIVRILVIPGSVGAPYAGDMEYARLADNPRAAVAAALDGDAAGLAVATSGSTAEPRQVLISREAIVASSVATRERLGGPGAWVLAIPATRIGGALVLARATIDRTPLVDIAGPFDVESFAIAAEALSRDHGGRRYVSLVPTQVSRLLATERGTAALESFHAVLVGGAALPGVESGARLISTYGMTETCGGCVYDGVPLDGVGVAVEPSGRILLSGPTLADGYEDDDDAFFADASGARWFRSSDVGTWDGSRLAVSGRADDVINTGAMKAHPVRVERALESLPGIAEAAVAGVADPEWGHRVVAWVVPTGSSPTIGEVRAALATDLAVHELPRELVTAISLPRSPGGKIDRPAMRALAAAHARREESE